jgi:Tfp pilus assembly protein PilP
MMSTIRQLSAFLVAVLLCLAALPGTGQQPSTTGTGTQGGGGKPPAKAGAKAPAATPKGGAPATGAATPAKPGATTGSSAAAGSGGAPPAGGAAGAAGSKTPPGGKAPGPPAIGSPLPDTGNIDQILEGDEAVLEGNAFTYDPGNRRDPFKSLLIAPDRPEFRGPRPEGIPGLLIDEIDLKGIFRTARGYVAQVNASNQKKSFLLKEGDQLYDGDVVSIGKNEVVFKQIVQDPTALKPFREVVKSLNPG